MMLRTAGLLPFLSVKGLSAGFTGGISPAALTGRFGAAQLPGGWDLTGTGLSPVSPSKLGWAHVSEHFNNLCMDVVS